MTLTGPRTIDVGFRRAARTTLTLRDENGRPISGASVAVLQRMAVPGGKWVAAHAPIVTDGDGRVRYLIKPGYSRTLRFAYRSHVGDGAFAVTRELTVRVRSKTMFRTDRAFLRNGQAVRFIGRLRSRPVPRAGVVIDLQAKVGNRWQTFNTVRTKADGKWHASYRFRRTTGLQTYVFRARVRGDTGFPYAPSISRHRAVRVRG
jgi:5-hydroxyisourate hydrolase-like protein (transthyretin family)